MWDPPRTGLQSSGGAGHPPPSPLESQLGGMQPLGPPFARKSAPTPLPTPRPWRRGWEPGGRRFPHWSPFRCQRPTKARRAGVCPRPPCSPSPGRAQRAQAAFRISHNWIKAARVAPTGHRAGHCGWREGEGSPAGPRARVSLGSGAGWGGGGGRSGLGAAPQAPTSRKCRLGVPSALAPLALAPAGRGGWHPPAARSAPTASAVAVPT